MGENNVEQTNYLPDKRNIDDDIYALIIDDMDTDFLVLDSGNDILLFNDVTDWELYYTGSTNRAPAIDLGEHEFGWYLLDLDDDHIAEGGSNELGYRW